MDTFLEPTHPLESPAHSTPALIRSFIRLFVCLFVCLFVRQVRDGHPRGGVCGAQDPSRVLGRRGLCQGEVHHSREQGGVSDAGTLRPARRSPKVAGKREKRRGHQGVVHSGLGSGASDQLQTTDPHHAHPGEPPHIIHHT